jgi:hypothetical protein
MISSVAESKLFVSAPGRIFLKFWLRLKLVNVNIYIFFKLRNHIHLVKISTHAVY